MRNRIATGLSTSDSAETAFAEAADRALEALGDVPVDLAAVFAGVPNIRGAEEGLEAVADRLGPRALIGCGAQGVVSGARELELGGVAVWAASLPGAQLEAFYLEAIRSDEGVAVTGMPEFADAEAVLLIADPYTFPIEPLLARLSEDYPGLPVIGGIASAGGGPGAATLLHTDGVAHTGAVGVVLSGVEVHAGVSQGACPVGPEMVITAAEANVIHELAGLPAVTKIGQAIESMSPEEQALAGGGLLLGIVIDPNKPEYVRGDFLVRGLVGADTETGAITVGEQVRVGQAVRLHVRDGASAHEDLQETLDAKLGKLAGPPAGSLLFTCTGRGSHMFDVPNHDAALVAGATGDAPLAGFFCAGEIGPVGDRNFVHGFTATMAVFA